LARLRDEYEQFVSRGVVIIALGPNPPATFEQYWRNERIPFIGLPDPEHKVALRYRQEVNLFKLGRMPLNCVVDGNGYIRYAHYAASMRDIPSNEELFQVIDELNNSSK
jgi:peroxiredoxin Q/BCP